MSLDLTLTFDGHRVRMVGSAERPEWIARDVCRVLHVHHAADALRNAGVTAEERGSTRVDTLGGPQDVTTVTEPGLWKLVLISRKPAAARFKSWLASEVLPSIRRHGCFPPPPERATLPAVDLDDPGSLRGLVEAFAIRRLADMEKIAELVPKAEAHDRLAAAGGDLSLRKAAKALRIPEKAFVARLLTDFVLFRDARGRLEPYARHIERGRFRVRAVVIGDGDEDVTTQALVTPLGLTWLAWRYPARPALRASTELVLQ